MEIDKEREAMIITQSRIFDLSREIAHKEISLYWSAMSDKDRETYRRMKREDSELQAFYSKLRRMEEEPLSLTRLELLRDIARNESLLACECHMHGTVSRQEESVETWRNPELCSLYDQLDILEHRKWGFA